MLLIFLFQSQYTQAVETNTSVQLVRGPYLQMGNPNGIIVRWNTDTPNIGRVRFGTTEGDLNDMATESSSSDTHEIELTGLQPGTVYFYAIGTSSEDIAGDDATHFFRTSPNVGAEETVRVWVIGDSGYDTYGQEQVRLAYQNYTDSTYTNLWLMLGDNAYSEGTDSEYQEKVFDSYQEILRTTPLWSTIGNHDLQSDTDPTSIPYFDIFNLTSNAEVGGVA